MGMYEICVYERFSMTDDEKFERRLRNWCKEAHMPGKSMLVFDKTSLNVGESPEIFRDETGEYYKVVLSNISLTYTHIAGTAMCIMHKIWENQTKSVMYNMPQKWDGTELWFGV